MLIDNSLILDTISPSQRLVLRRTISTPSVRRVEQLKSLELILSRAVMMLMKDYGGK